MLALSTPGPDQLIAQRQLHRLLHRAAAHQVWRMRDLVDGCTPQRVDDLAHGAADVAMTALLRKLHTFEGRSRFTTWAYKFAILQAASDVRQLAWSGRAMRLQDLDGTDLDLPDDGLALRLGTTRGALYKTVHVARTRLRAELTRRGYLPAPTTTPTLPPTSPPTPPTSPEPR